ncbi:hypothetical protein PC129_g24072 [Phytophthora cactorum]|uniref:Uncharacterized protein n=1 Tax=Phytophthora cactorum TaxID=29920 RepID=A0A8T1JFX7_9STRA|nr:hypothetical protein PC114_g25157 [Phytophthora cactorum]KAG2882372.1 hypothetical protein PC117_g26240 [Phytophthora cactorum]KAG2962083.1 hypothetical protein PC119_g25921 [Phytophthora cactorum]KAG2977710.1 hypothetical protein PC120_g25446 [Phytophthora cactorum]KAG3123607.1 hypothetical protein C6341_g26484 [Phytophthora cactorum]
MPTRSADKHLSTANRTPDSGRTFMKAGLLLRFRDFPERERV